MPPIPQQQSSRSGLIAALVVSIVFAVGFLIWAIMSSADGNRATTDLKALQSKYKEVISDAAVGGVADLKAQMSADPSKPRTGTLVDVAVEQRQALMNLLVGDKAASEKRATDEYNATIQSFKDNPGLKGATIPTTGGTINIIRALASKAQADADSLNKARADLAKANQDLQAAVASHQAEIAKRDQAVQEAQASAQKAIADAKAAIDEKQKQVDDFAAKVAASEKALTDLTATQQVNVQTLTANLDKSKKDYEKVLSQLRVFKPDTKESIIRNVDATITQISADNICYINLGFGDHITNGMTFEVYGKNEGVPKLESGTDVQNMPKGKGSIEVINIGQNSTQCRIIATTPGTTISQGDLCVNVVYDRNIKPTFFVYGNFDMDQNGVATAGEADVIKNLITRWGGKIADKVSNDVDFVVMGKEPSVPLYTPEELQSPIIKQKQEEAKAQVDAYNKIRDDAVSLQIPIMNQNRFLYYTGYFETAKK